MSTQEKDKNDGLLSGAFENKASERSATENGPQEQPEYGTGSTTQGGSNYGQGSSELGKPGDQGSEKTKGSNYNNEKGFNSK